MYLFAHELREGDLVLTPLKTHRGSVAIARVTGPYEYRPEPPFVPEAMHTHKATWLNNALPVDALPGSVTEKLKFPQTVAKLEVSTETVESALKSPEREALHLVVKWAARRRADTIERHREVAERRGSVWWGLATSSNQDWRISEEWLQRLTEQVSAGVATHVYLAGQTCWRTDLRAITYSRDEIDESLVPAHYADFESQRYHL